MATCHVESQPAMYGLGIRIAVYIQWYFTAIFNKVDAAQLPELRLLGLVLSTSLVLSLVIQSARSALQPAETYILILLSTGEQLFLLPMYIWCAATCFDPIWSPFYWSKEQPNRIVRFLSYAVAVTGACAAMWFFTSLSRLDDHCERIGFAFGKISMRNTGFIVLNCMLYVGILVACIVILAADGGCIVNDKKPSERQARKRMQQGCFIVKFRFMCDGTVCVVLFLAIELAVRWNGIPSSDGIITSSGSLALLTSICVVIGVVNRYRSRDADSDVGDSWPVAYQEWLADQQRQHTQDEEVLRQTRWSEGRQARTV